ncbi:MAG: cupin domain-containing protein [Myxococcales bacterium]|nr:cupin domain-containing protein [Myxococcales bacterium]
MPELGPSHHPEPDELLAYAAGTTEPWLSTLMACHLTLCPHCRQELVMLEELAGVMIEDFGQELEADTAGTPLLPKPVLSPTAERVIPPRPVVPGEIASQVPRPLHGFFAEPVPRFRFLAPGVSHIPLTLDGGGRPVRLVRFRPGFVVPEHAHAGLEWLLILSGHLLDATTGQRFARGDVSERDTEDVHTQLIGKDEPCVAVFAHLGPPIPRTLMGRILSKIVGL